MHRSPARIAAVLLGAMFLLLTWLLYKGDFWSLHTLQQKVDAIVEYASAEPEDTSSLRAVLHPQVHGVDPAIVKEAGGVPGRDAGGPEAQSLPEAEQTGEDQGQ